MRSLKHSIPGHGAAALIALSLAACAQTPASQTAAQPAVAWQSVATTDNQQAFAAWRAARFSTATRLA